MKEMNSMKKRLLSILLSFALVAALLPVSVLANESASETSQTYDLSKGSITVKVDAEGKQTISQPDNPDSPITDEEQTEETVIKQTSATATTNTITITAAENQTARVTLSGVNINVSTAGVAAVSTAGTGTVIIELDEANTIKSGNNHAGLEKNNTGTLTITDANGTNGKLNATGGSCGAGIGGGNSSTGSNITINGGTVTATGGDYAAGIGGGSGCNGSNITISGGTVTATGGFDAAGIGGGQAGQGFNIKITGGTVTAAGAGGGAGIGGGSGCNGSNITISGGTVTAVGATGGAGIGGGQRGTGSDITVSGSAKLKVQGGKNSQQEVLTVTMPYIVYIGAGAGIGNGGSTSDDGKAVPGEEIPQDPSALASDGEIKYYAPGADIKTAAPIDTVSKTTPTLTLSANSGTVYSNAGTTSFTYTYDGDGEVSASSSDKDVATVSVDTENKIVTAEILKAGTTTITVSAAAGTNYNAADAQTYDLTVTKVTPTLTLSANSGRTDWKAGTTSFTYTYDGDGEVSVDSSNKDVATVSVDPEKRTVTAEILKVGTTTITVSAAAGTNYTAAKAQTYNLTVTKVTPTLWLWEHSGTVDSNAGTTSFDYLYDGDEEVSVDSSNKDVATVSVDPEKRTVTAEILKVGTTTITVSAAEGTNYNAADAQTYDLTVTKGAPALTLSANSGTVDSNAGTTSFTYTYNGDGTVSVDSSNKDVATVSVDTKNKKVTAKILKAGNATITVSVTEGTNYTAAAQKYDLTVSEPYDENKTYSSGDVFSFGSYPQSKVMDTALISALEKAGKDIQWIDYNYYASTTTNSQTGGTMHVIENMMMYKDITYEGKTYRAVQINKYRPFWTGYESADIYCFQDDNGYTTGNTYYFLYEPLVWKVLDPSTGYVMCTRAIDSQAYNNFIIYDGYECYNSTSYSNYATDWAGSSLREWLNNDFYNTAFNDEEKAKIGKSHLNNESTHDVGDKYDSEDTDDNIFILSFYDATNSKYGFNSKRDWADQARKFQGTDYAKCQGLYTEGGNAWWYLRTAATSKLITGVRNDGNASYGGDSYETYSAVKGIIPALKFNEYSITLKYELDGGEWADASYSAPTSYMSNESPALPTADKLIKKGYTLSGWTVIEDSKTEKTYKAVWTSKLKFVDVPTDSYFYDAVLWAVEKNITAGRDSTHFCPDDTCTRAEAVRFLWNAYGQPKPTLTTMTFKDVPKDSYYYDAVLWAVEKGITVGTSKDTFSPDENCTRAQIVAMLWRAEKYPEAGTENPFNDVDKEAYYYDAVLWAANTGVTAGTSKTTFSPNQDCTRAQIVSFLYRAFGK